MYTRLWRPNVAVDFHFIVFILVSKVFISVFKLHGSVADFWVNDLIVNIHRVIELPNELRFFVVVQMYGNSIVEMLCR